MRPMPTGFWVATDDPSRSIPWWFRTERDARLFLAHMFLGELSIITERGHIHCQALSKRPHPTPRERQSLWLLDFNWAESIAGAVLLRLWDAHHGLQPGDFVKIDWDVGISKGDRYWCGPVTEVAGHVVYLSKTEFQHTASGIP